MFQRQNEPNELRTLKELGFQFEVQGVEKRGEWWKSSSL